MRDREGAGESEEEVGGGAGSEMLYVHSHMDFGANGIFGGWGVGGRGSVRSRGLRQTDEGSLSIITRPICEGSELRLFHSNCRSHQRHMYLLKELCGLMLRL